MKTAYEAPKLDNLSLRATHDLIDIDAYLAGNHILSIHLLGGGGGS